jgi:hypothetical protein
MGNFGGLQSRLDEPGDADRHLVLKVEHVFERAVEAVGPEMRAGRRVDQLCGNAHALACLAQRAFEDVANAQFRPDLLHIGRGDHHRAVAHPLALRHRPQLQLHLQGPREMSRSG